MSVRNSLGRHVAPWRFILFGALLIGVSGALVPLIGWRHGAMAGFDLAALAFLATLLPLFRQRASDMRARAAENDANRAALLAISAAVNLIVLVAVGSELADHGGPRPADVALIVGTLALAWTFANIVYALHYAHIFYLKGDDRPGDRGGLDFPDTDEPGYWEFVYFSFTLGMTFQTSDVEITSTQMRIVSIFHALAAFVFNLGVIAFTINILGQS